MSNKENTESAKKPSQPSPAENYSGFIFYTGFLFAALGMAQSAKKAPFGHSTVVGHQMAVAGLSLIIFAGIATLIINSYKDLTGRNIATSNNNRDAKDIEMSIGLRLASVIMLTAGACYAVAAGKNTLMNNTGLSNTHLAGGKSLHIASALALAAVALAFFAAWREASLVHSHNKNKQQQSLAPSDSAHAPLLTTDTRTDGGAPSTSNTKSGPPQTSPKFTPAMSFFNQSGATMLGFGAASAGVIAGMYTPLILAGLALSISAFLFKDVMFGTDVMLSHKTPAGKKLGHLDAKNSTAGKLEGAATIGRAASAAVISGVAGKFFYDGAMPSSFSSPYMIALLTAASVITFSLLVPLVSKAKEKWDAPAPEPLVYA